MIAAGGFSLLHHAQGRLTVVAAFDQVGEGYFAILIAQGSGMQPYQGITPLAGGSLSAVTLECRSSERAMGREGGGRMNGWDGAGGW